MTGIKRIIFDLIRFDSSESNRNKLNRIELSNNSISSSYLHSGTSFDPEISFSDDFNYSIEKLDYELSEKLSNNIIPQHYHLNINATSVNENIFNGTVDIDLQVRQLK